ncbi:hypothetical protein HYDPIDRAFT_30416 [Hydnomerulius pinastri MD-312]|uniref:UBC core domain-containing protein n=1 Tax=Hydnomerulius pinastri MD-312 TaxID=994086 RepID=A0A0C9V9T5_9AGAM|nr:hypothetical protein HYDPIDRAFT_30416 [Hydnomerulius pinastri MD-312]
MDQAHIDSDDDMFMDAPEVRVSEGSSSSTLGTPTQSVAKPLKGRKRFNADLLQLKNHPELISRSDKWSVKRVRPGDDDGSIDVALMETASNMLQAVSLLVSDTSEYPNNHTIFGYSPDSGPLEAKVTAIVEKLSVRPGCTLQDAAEFLVREISRSDEDDDDDEGGEDEIEIDDHMSIDEDFSQALYQGLPRTSRLRLGQLKKDFVEAKAAGYSPGILWAGSGDFILSISIPLTELTKCIPPHALLAWDRHFLEPGQHLTLLISGMWGFYPLVQRDGTLLREAARAGANLKFKVGFTQKYKPSPDSATTAFRQFTLKDSRDKKKPEPINPFFDLTGDSDDEDYLDNLVKGPENEVDEAAFQRMSLSNSLESLLDQHLLRLIQLREKFNFGWAAAEELLWQAETSQENPSTIVLEKREMLEKADVDEQELSASYKLPDDSIDPGSTKLNLLTTSFSFLLRRLALCTRHCVICHKKLQNEYEALKPYVCDSNLCIFQYYSLNLGPSLEYDIIANTEVVDLLVSLAYTAAADQVLDEPLPRGMGLLVPRPAGSVIQVDDGGLCQFDSLSVQEMRSAIVMLLNSLPPIGDMKKYLQRKSSADNTRLRDMDPDVLPAAWSLLRWSVASCTAHIQELTDKEDCLKNISPQFRQFRFMVGAPDKEAKFKTALEKETAGDANAQEYPTLFGFHGSPLKNWHSIIRHGLWYKSIAHGRAHGHGVYFAKDGNISMRGYAAHSAHRWKNSMLLPTNCFALAEIVNRPQQFVSQNPYYVVDKTDWIMCRYLLVQYMGDHSTGGSRGSWTQDAQRAREPQTIQEGRYLTQDPKCPAMLDGQTVGVPQPSYHIDKLLAACAKGCQEVGLDQEDRGVFDAPDDDDDPPEPNLSTETETILEGITTTSAFPPLEEWKPDAEWTERNVEEMSDPPRDSSPSATMALQKEFKAMLKEQKLAEKKNDLATLGWYMSPDHNGDNLYQWIVEMHSFDPELPISKDMKTKGVNSLVFEIRFPPSFPHSPPFFRIIRPRFLTYMHGGGGHITVGGSICMDLLTSDGWLPSYSISAVLLQIKLAISSTDPRPARLQETTWDRPYTAHEALHGYTRAAAMHNWKISNAGEIQKLVTNR